MTQKSAVETGTTRVLVTGVRGKTGQPLAGLLAARPGVEVLGGSSDPTTVTLDGVIPTVFSWDDPSGWPAALADVDAVYVVRPDRPDAPELIGALLAQTAPETRVVLLSEQDAGYDALDAWALRSERAVRSSGREWTILRPSWFMQVFTDPRFYRDLVTSASELPFPSGGRSVAWIDARDIAAVAERALLEDGHHEQTYELSGPEAVSLPRTAELLSRAKGAPLTHQEVAVEDALAGAEGFERDIMEVTFERLRAGTFAVVTDSVERVTGRPARSLEAFVAEAEPVLRRAV